MASSTPPPHCTLTTSKPYQNHHFHHPQNQHHQRQRNTTSQQYHPTWNPQKFSLNSHQSPHPTYRRPPAPTYLSASEFSGRRSTRFVSKMHFGRPKSTASCRHSVAAEEVLDIAASFKSDRNLDDVLLNFESKLCASDDYIFLLRELGNRGDWVNALACFKFAVGKEKRVNELGKLATSMISTLGRLGKVDLAKNVFDEAVEEGYGNTVYAYSALISAYAKSGYCDEAIGVFRRMKDSGLRPNLVTYNSLIDACAKGGADIKRALQIFDDMLQNGVQPDRITYNSLLAVCSGSGLWDTAKGLFDEMLYRGIDQDIYTYNTLLDAACGGGHFDVAFEIMAEMPVKNILPNQVTYSTMIRGCAKVGKLDRALDLFNEMKLAGIKLDRVSYNTLLAIYASLGRFEEALAVGQEMESIGIKKDVVTYNALLDGFGKQGLYDKVKELFAEMKAEHLCPNLLTYSTLVSVYFKGGLYKEAMEVYKEFKQQGLKADVVFYSKLIDALCKKGLVESSAILLDEMMGEGIQPNVVTYNSIINAFGQSETVGDLEAQMKSLDLVALQQHATDSKLDEVEDDKVVEIFKQLACGKSSKEKRDSRGTKDLRCVLGVFRKMHELEIKPNVVTFSAILNACSRCSSFEEASLLLEELRLFDNQVYGVAHGLLMGHNENTWARALSLFDQVKRMDSSTASAFYNALTDMLWHFGQVSNTDSMIEILQKRGAQLVVLEGKRRDVWENTWSESCLDLHLMSSGAAQAMVHAWLLNICSIVYEGRDLPQLLSILTGWGKHSKVVGDGALKRAVEALLLGIGAPFRIAKCNIGRFISTGAVVAAWLRESGTHKVLVLHDNRTQTHQGASTRFDLLPSLQPLPLL